MSATLAESRGGVRYSAWLTDHRDGHGNLSREGPDVDGELSHAVPKQSGDSWLDQYDMALLAEGARPSRVASLLKGIVLWLYGRGILSLEATDWSFKVLGLRSA